MPPMAAAMPVGCSSSCFAIAVPMQTVGLAVTSYVNAKRCICTLWTVGITVPRFLLLGMSAPGAHRFIEVPEQSLSVNGPRA